jgi:hypothetical protein
LVSVTLVTIKIYILIFFVSFYFVFVIICVQHICLLMAGLIILMHEFALRSARPCKLLGFVGLDVAAVWLVRRGLHIVSLGA